MKPLHFVLVPVTFVVTLLAILGVLNAAVALFVADTWLSAANAVMWALGTLYLRDKLALSTDHVGARIVANMRQARAADAQR